MRVPHSQGAFRELIVAAARYSGALEVVATDLHDAPLAKAIEMGATRTVNVALEPGLKAEEFTAYKGYFDVAIECTGAAAVLKDVIPALRPRGTIIQVGVTGEVPIPINAIVGKEIRLVGSFRFYGEYALAARLIKEGRINVKPIITSTLPGVRALDAFELASDRRSQMRVQPTF